MSSQPRSASTSVALCVDWANDTLTVIDTSAPTTQPLPVSQVLRTGAGPRALAVGSGGTRVYVPNWRAATLSVFKRENGTTSLLNTSAVGADPCAVLAGLAHEQVCVASRGGNSVSVVPVDGGYPQTSPLGTGSLPHALAGSPDGARVLVANWGTGSASLLDVSDATAPTLLDPPLKLGGSPRVLAAHPGRPVGYAAVWNTEDGGKSGTVYAIDLSGSRPTALEPAVAVGAQPRAMAVTEDGSFLYVANHGSASVSVLPLRPDTGALTGTSRTVGVGPNPVAVAVQPGGTDCYVVSQTAGTVAALDTAGRTLMALPVGRTPAGLAAASGYLYVTDNGTGKLTTVRTMPLESRKLDARTRAAPVNVAVSPDGGCVYTADFGTTTVSVLPTNAPSGKTIDLSEDNRPWGVAIAANGGLACATAPAADRLFILPKGTNGICDATGITPEPIDLGVGTAPRGVAITPDSRYAVTANAGNGTVSLVGLPGQETITHEEIKAQPIALAVSEDGAQLYVSGLFSGGPTPLVSVLRHDSPKGAWMHSMEVNDDRLSGLRQLAIADGGDKGPCLYGAAAGNNRLAVFRRTVSDTWVAECTVEQEAGALDSPWGLAQAPQRGLLFVANLGTDSAQIAISVFAVRPDEDHIRDINPKYYGSIALSSGSAEVGLGISTDEKYLYVAAYDFASVKKIYAVKLKERIDETTTEYYETVQEISHSALNSPSDVACSPSGEELYVANRGVKTADGQEYEGGGVYVLTLDDDRLTLKGDPRPLLTDTRGMPHSVAAAAGRVYVAHRESRTISVLNQPVSAVPCFSPGGSTWGTQDVACTADGSYAYVTDRPGKRVHLFDLPGQRFVDTTLTPRNGVPMDVVCAPSGVRAYVIESGTKTVAVLQREFTEVATGATLAEASRGVALHPSRSLLYVAHKSKLHPLATEWNASGTDLDVGSDLRGVAIHPDGTHGYLVDGVDGTEGGATTATIHVVGLTDPGSPTDTGKAGYLPQGVKPTATAIHQTGGHTVLYVAGQAKEKGGVWAYSVAGDHTTLTAEAALDNLGRAYALAVRADPVQACLYLVTEDQDGCRLHVLDLSSPTSPAPIGTTVPLPDGVRELAIHPRGWYGYATTASGGVLVLDMGNPLRPHHDNHPRSVSAGTPGGMALDPAGRAYLTRDTVVNQVLLGSSYVQGQYSLAGDPQTVAISGNGEHLFVTTAETPGQLTVLDAWTGQLRGHIKAGNDLAGMALSSDGQHLYIADRGGSAVSVVDTPLDTTLGTTDVGLDPRQVICT